MTDTVRDDSHSDYHAVKSQAVKAMQRGVWTDRFENRFLPFSDREMRCDISRESIAKISEAKHYASYRGIPMAKDPFDIVLYEMLFYELQPRTVIELGAYSGASAYWMADTLRNFKIDAQVFSVDIDLSLVDDDVMKDGSVKFIQGSCEQIEEVFPSDVLRDLPHPLILIDDAHVNIAGVYRHFHKYAFERGDYLIIEDTIPWIPAEFGKSDGQKAWGEWKWNEVKEFFRDYEADYQVDCYYTDFFGYNATWNWNGFVQRR